MVNLPDFKSFNEDEFRIIDIKPCTAVYLFHASGKELSGLDPRYNKKLELYGSVHEYGLPVVFASDKPSNAHCYLPTAQYLKAREEAGISVYHRLTHGGHRILLGAQLQGYIYVVLGKDFYEVTREDLELGEWRRSVEWVSPHHVVPIERIAITRAYDWEMLPEYEYLGQDYVGEMPAEQYLALATDDVVKEAIRTCISQPFVPFVPDELKKYTV